MNNPHAEISTLIKQASGQLGTHQKTGRIDFPPGALKYPDPAARRNHEVDPPNLFTAQLAPEAGPGREFVAVGWSGEQWDESTRVLSGYGAQSKAPHLADFEVIMLTINTDLPDGCHEIEFNPQITLHHGLMYIEANYMMTFRALSGSVTLKFNKMTDVVEATLKTIAVPIHAYGNPGDGPDSDYILSINGSLLIHRGFFGDLPYP